MNADEVVAFVEAAQAPASASEPWWMAGWPKHVSPSSLGRVAACVRSEAMPHASSSSPFATRGTIAHKFLADCLEVGKELALGLVEDPSDIGWLDAIDVERLPAFHPEAYSAEISFAYHPGTRTARELGRNIGRTEARRLATPEELVGSVDVGGYTDELAVVGDYKTGHGYVEPAEINWQLKTYALMMARCYQKSGAFFSVIRVLDSGFIWYDSAQMDEIELLDHEDRLIDLLRYRERIQGLARAGKWSELPAFAEGKHCKYCPARWACPVKTNAPLRLLGVLAGGAQQMNPELGGLAWKEVRNRELEIERVRSILIDYARTTPLPLGDGEVLGERLTPKESIVPEKARLVLERQYGPLGSAVAGEATERKDSMSKERFRNAVRKLILPTLPKEDRKITHVERLLHGLLREAGAMSVRVDRSVVEHVPPKAEPGAAAAEEEAA